MGMFARAGRAAGLILLAPILLAAALLAGSAAAQAPAPKPGFLVLDADTVRAAQSRLLSAETGDIRPGVPGRTELFAVLAAWYPDQQVFLREVEAASGILTDRFGAVGRVVMLANSMVRPMGHPLATTGNFEAAIEAVRAKMNVGEDVLLVYLTSHGGPQVIAGENPPLGTRDLTAAELALVLDQARVPNTVAVISACKSGSFVPLIAAPDRLIITAAAADRNSFGCSDANDWTWFGEAFFDHALRQTRSFPEAFARAAALVGKWEIRDDEIPSRPQMAQGAEVGAALDRLARDAGG